ncbi:hypothetical protein Hs30E_09760 [Lactococcus hodotermopsidis]|uniref:Uncharacterized protein n=1 Tax=Pseudolactococcus hodotermopsidis TaxID=2709157 RepID=A0A6A0BCQ2_9LACT|nr:hypothetical protein [Lactococcus hodotermopsidis]GFH42425.1 hypothetical protein Hs30E_09760 [Lactococcus hodotermopsidis]
MNEKIDFNDCQIEQLFGTLAAEDDEVGKFESYFLKTDVYNQIHNDMKLRILVAQKGVGKSAVFKKSFLEDEKECQLSLWVRPDDIADIAKTSNKKDTLELIKLWKQGLDELIIRKVLGNFDLDFENANVNSLAKKSVKIAQKIADILKAVKDRVDIDEVKKEIANTYLKSSSVKVKIYIDDLDRAWEGSRENVARISALLNAVRDMSNESQNLAFRVSLRSDVFSLVQVADESMDKIGTNVIWLGWTQHELLAMLVKRVQLYFGNTIPEEKLLAMHQDEMTEYLEKIMELRFKGSGKWHNEPIRRILLTLIRKRPRDLINLCTYGARTANKQKHKVIMTEDWEENFEKYSQDRFKDTINEHKYELKNIEKLMLGMKPTTSEIDKRRTGKLFVYSKEKLMTKMNNIISSGDYRFSYKSEKATADELIGFLYKINFIIARKVLENGYIDRKYHEENNYLVGISGIDYGYEWEIHPAFRKVLYPRQKNIFDLIDVSE